MVYKFLGFRGSRFRVYKVLLFFGKYGGFSVGFLEGFERCFCLILHIGLFLAGLALLRLYFWPLCSVEPWLRDLGLAVWDGVGSVIKH